MRCLRGYWKPKANFNLDAAGEAMRCLRGYWKPELVEIISGRG